MWNQIFFNNGDLAADQKTDSVYRDSSESFRKLMGPDQVMAPKIPPRILLVDDDPSFLKIVSRAAKKKGINITCCQSLDEFGALKNWDYDVVIMDYDLGAVTGFELTSYIEQFTKEEVPVILISQTQRAVSKSWPNTIKEFVHKNLGPFAILDASFEAHEIARIHKEMQAKQRTH